MPKYYCNYVMAEGSGTSLIIEANDHAHAYEAFLESAGIKYYTEAERGKSELASSIVTGIAIGNFAKVHQLKEMQEMNETMDQIAEDVEDVNEGFGFE